MSKRDYHTLALAMLIILAALAYEGDYNGVAVIVAGVVAIFRDVKDAYEDAK